MRSRALISLVVALVAGCTCGAPAIAPPAVDEPPPVVTVIAEDRPAPASVSVDREHAYWVERATGDVMRAPRAGGAAASKLASTGFTESRSLAVGGGYVYYLHPGEGATYRVPAGGGSPERVSMPGELAADATHVYVAGHSLVRLRHDGVSEDVWPAEPMRGGTLALGPTAACTIDPEGVLRCAGLEDGAVRTLARGFGRDRALAVSGTHAYACAADAVDLVMRVPLAGGAPEFVADACGLASALAADEHVLYVVEIDGLVHRIDPDAATDAIVGTIPGSNRSHLDAALDGSALFVASDASSLRVTHLDLTGRTPLPEGDLVDWNGIVASVDLGRAPESTRPIEHRAWLAWIDREDDETLQRASDRVLLAGDALVAALRSGRLALRLGSPDAALAERTADRLRARLTPTFGERVQVIADPAASVRASAGQVEVVVDLQELAASYAPE